MGQREWAIKARSKRQDDGPSVRYMDHSSWPVIWRSAHRLT